MASLIDLVGLLRALLAHRRQVLPAVRAQQAIWRGSAELIPDPALREAAIGSLREKGTNAEATGVFAILAPPAQRRGALRAMTALQTAVDYLDTLSEEPGSSLEDAVSLHRALPAAVSTRHTGSDWYRHHRHREDGGYLDGLVEACRREVATLPGAGRIGTTLELAANRCAEGQSRTHAAGEDRPQLEAWAGGLAAPGGYLWWELAAGASSSVAIHALIAAAADPGIDAAGAEAIDAAYFPPIGALTVLLDDLVDRERDAAAGEHNYLRYCLDPELAANRLGFLADRALAAVETLPRRSLHGAILSGVGGFYLAAPEARNEFGAAARVRLLESLGLGVRLVIAAIGAGQLA